MVKKKAKRGFGETSYKETAFGIIPRSKLIPLEIEGVKKAWDFIVSKSKRNEVRLTPSFFKQIHRKGFGRIFPKMGGCFRTIEVRVSDHRPPESYRVPAMILDFTKDLKIRLKYLQKTSDEKYLKTLIETLAWAHHRFLWIHPFADYNGRMARLLTNMILLKLELPPIELKIQTGIGRKKYVMALKEADMGDNGKLERIIKEAIEETTQEIIF